MDKMKHYLQYLYTSINKLPCHDSTRMVLKDRIFKLYDEMKEGLPLPIVKHEAEAISQSYEEYAETMTRLEAISHGI